LLISTDLFFESVSVFACGQFGFVEVSSLHLLASVLSWQNPTSGCFTNDRSANLIASTSFDQRLPDFHSPFSRRILSNFLDKDTCSLHSATVAAGALVVFLRFLLDGGPWSEYHLADQPVVIHSIAAEDKFRQYRYGAWMRDSLVSSIQHSRPPHIGWSLDLLAYLLLLCIILIGSIVMHLCYKPRVKQFYHFSYKKL
uniref:Dolichyl-P-Glc:Glc(2)Man(9)GlcNAc(2)-PP-dolichol alpha-1,2-glucosyltransferase n=1 Tax=Gongylonema pulchrum TaxID=637853 RepID=A0A183DXJ7_9BILA